MVKSGGKCDGFPVGASYGATCGFSESSILVVDDYSKVNILFLELIEALKNSVRLAHVNEILKESMGGALLGLKDNIIDGDVL